jgi:hypothetical protein
MPASENRHNFGHCPAATRPDARSKSPPAAAKAPFSTSRSAQNCRGAPHSAQNLASGVRRSPPQDEQVGPN